jgi:hypothetical protein
MALTFAALDGMHKKKPMTNGWSSVCIGWESWSLERSFDD